MAGAPEGTARRRRGQWRAVRAVTSALKPDRDPSASCRPRDRSARFSAVLAAALCARRAPCPRNRNSARAATAAAVVALAATPALISKLMPTRHMSHSAECSPQERYVDAVEVIP